MSDEPQDEQTLIGGKIMGVLQDCARLGDMGDEFKDAAVISSLTFAEVLLPNGDSRVRIYTSENRYTAMFGLNHVGQTILQMHMTQLLQGG